MGARRYEIYLRVFNSISHSFAALTREISRLNTRRLISYLQAPMYYSIYYINLDQLFQKVNIQKAISGHAHVFDTISEHMCSDTTFVSGQNPYNTHCILYNKLYF